MKAIRIHDFGDPGELTVDDVARPVPAATELLVRVHAVGVNPIDWIVRQGESEEPLDVSLPWIPGWDFSGAIEAVGSNVTEFEIGDAVYGLVRMPQPGNTYAEYVTVPATEVVPTPTSLDHTEAAGVPMVSLTAWHALFEEGELEDGQRVLIHAAAGGVGHMAVQFAKQAGAYVIGTASGRNEEFLRTLGADEFVNYREQRFERVIDPVDVVIDAIGGETLSRLVDVLTDGGTLVTLPVEPDEELVQEWQAEHAVDTRWFSVEPNATTLAEINTLIDAGYIKPTISDVYPLSEAATAHETSEAGHVRGKLVLDTINV
jgi:NADPH:quinone reductase-like Zn-dependent oxidoreductase